MHGIKTSLDFIGDEIHYTAGRVTITLHWVRPNVYGVITRQGASRVEDNCGSYTTEAEARAVARGYAELAKAEHAAQVRDELLRELHAAQRASKRVDNRATIARLNAEIDALDTPEQREADRVVLSDLADRLAAANSSDRELSGWGRLKAAHAAGLGRDRAERAARREFGAVA